MNSARKARFIDRLDRVFLMLLEAFIDVIVKHLRLRKIMQTTYVDRLTAHEVTGRNIVVKESVSTPLVASGILLVKRGAHVVKLQHAAEEIRNLGVLSGKVTEFNKYPLRSYVDSTLKNVVFNGTIIAVGATISGFIAARKMILVDCFIDAHTLMFLEEGEFFECDVFVNNGRLIYSELEPDQHDCEGEKLSLIEWGRDEIEGILNGSNHAPFESSQGEELYNFQELEDVSTETFFEPEEQQVPEESQDEVVELHSEAEESTSKVIPLRPEEVPDGGLEEEDVQQNNSTEFPPISQEERDVIHQECFGEVGSSEEADTQSELPFSEEDPASASDHADFSDLNEELMTSEEKPQQREVTETKEKKVKAKTIATVPLHVCNTAKPMVVEVPLYEDTEERHSIVFNCESRLIEAEQFHSKVTLMHTNADVHADTKGLMNDICKAMEQANDFFKSIQSETERVKASDISTSQMRVAQQSIETSFVKLQSAHDNATDAFDELTKLAKEKSAKKKSSKRKSS